MSPKVDKPRRLLFALIGVLAVGLGVAFAVSPADTSFSNGGGETVAGGSNTSLNWHHIRWGETNLVGSLDAGLAFDECRSPYSPIPAWARSGYRWFGRWGSFACDNPATNVPAWLVDRRETNACSLNLDLERECLDQALDADKRQTLFLGLSFVDHCGRSPSLRVSLLSTNGTTVLASDHNLIEGSGNAVAVVLQLPVTVYPEVVCIHIAATAPATVFETLLYIDTAKNNAKHIKEIGRWSVSEHIFDPDHDGGNTNHPGPNPWPTPAPTNTPGPIPTPDPTPVPSEDFGVVYVSQAHGSDSYTGYAPTSQPGKKCGPTKTCRAGLKAVRPETHTLVLQSGSYGESLDLRSRPIKLVVTGSIRL